MLNKVLSFVFPNFKNLKFLIQKSLVAQIVFNERYSFFYLLSSFFSKNSLTRIFMYSNFYLKSYSIH